MANIEQIRHSLAHILAAVVKKQYPRAKLGIGPAIENGFYYDFDFSDGEVPAPDDLARLEKGMFSIVNKKVAFAQETLSPAEAKNYFKDEPYKLELIDELEDSSFESEKSRIGMPDETDCGMMCRRV
ncbi:MAG: hypothetical protein NTY66_03725 [Candidatus Vogelbacteria bacterium]|nr:hypothetical protein [Candidatus Vogelbacteria bacterium]